MSRNYATSPTVRTLRDASKRATRAALLNAAKDLFDEQGYDRVSVTEIGRRAGVSHTLINAYFDGKAGLMWELVAANNAPQLAQTEAIATGPGMAADRIDRILRLWAAVDARTPHLLALMQAHTWVWSAAAEAVNRVDRDRALGWLAMLIAEGQASGELAPVLTPQQAADAIFAIYTLALRRVVFETLSPDQAMDAIWPQVQVLIGAG